MNENLFPCILSKENIKLAEEAVQLSVKTWGARSLSELEVEERLSYSCEKVKHVEDDDFFQTYSLTYPCNNATLFKNIIQSFL